MGFGLTLYSRRRGKKRLLMKLCTLITCIISWQKVRMDVREARSNSLTASCEPLAPVSWQISRDTTSARLASRQAMITRPWSLTMPVAVARPIPLLAPVTITVFPFIILSHDTTAELQNRAQVGYIAERLHYPQFPTSDRCLRGNSLKCFSVILHSYLLYCGGYLYWLRFKASSAFDKNNTIWKYNVVDK